MRKATVAIEDHRFYQHGGVDYEGIARAAWKDLSAGHVVQGGSTITQQLVRNLYISKERTFKRKLKEACLAIKLSRAKSRRSGSSPQYMNQVYYGNHAYGIEAAAQTYFSKHAKRADARPGRAARRPAPGAVVLRPVAPTRRRRSARRDERARARCSDTATSPPTQYRGGDRPARPPPEAGQALHADPRAVLLQLRARPADRGVRLEHGSLGRPRVYTTIDPRLQLAATKAIRDTLYLRDDPAAAVVSIDPANGAIRAMTAVDAGPHAATSSTSSPRRAASRARPSRTFVLDRGDRGGHEPVLDLLHVGAVPLPARPVHRRLGRADVRPRLLGLDLGHAARRCAPTTRSTRS